MINKKKPKKHNRCLTFYTIFKRKILGIIKFNEIRTVIYDKCNCGFLNIKIQNYTAY